MKRVLVVLAGLSILLPAVALGQPITEPPIGGNSTIPDFIPVVGTQMGVPHPGQSIQIVVRNFVNERVPYAQVELDFTNCSDTRLCDAAIPGAGTVSCPFSTVSATADANGELDLTVVGGGTHLGFNEPVVGADCVEIRADGVILGYATAYVVDQNGAIGGNGVNGADLALSKMDFLEYAAMGTYRGRSAFAKNPALTITGADLSAHKLLVIQSLGGQGSALGCWSGGSAQSYCP